MFFSFFLIFFSVSLGYIKVRLALLGKDRGPKDQRLEISPIHLIFEEKGERGWSARQAKYRIIPTIHTNGLFLILFKGINISCPKTN